MNPMAAFWILVAVGVVFCAGCALGARMAADQDRRGRKAGSPP